MLMTMGVFNKHDYEHELITLRQRKLYGIIESMEEMQFLNDQGNNIHSHLLNKKITVHNPL